MTALRTITAAVVVVASTVPANGDQLYANRVAFFQAVAEHRYADAVAIGHSVVAAQPGDDEFALNLAYAEQNAGQEQQASLAFSALAQSTNASIAQRARNAYAQLRAREAYDHRASFYRDIAAGEWTAAVREGDAADAIEPLAPAAVLDDAYAMRHAGDEARARAFFTRAAASGDAAVAGRARAELAMHPVAQPMHVAGFVQSESRFHDTFYGLDARRDLTNGRVTSYAVVHVSDDARSHASGAPQIYNDDAIVTNAGIETRVARGASAFAEAGFSAGMRGQRSFPETRVGVRYFTALGGPANAKPHVTFGASVTAYSRYAGNVIGYASGQYDLRLAPHVRAFVGVNGGVDTHRLTYNNFGEAVVGAQLALPYSVGLRIEQVRGSYMGAQPRMAPYTTTRIVTTFALPQR